jgi:hypothetical protein
VFELRVVDALLEGQNVWLAAPRRACHQAPRRREREGLERRARAGD